MKNMDLSQFTHKVLMLRPMQSGVGGFVRLMNRRGHVAAEVHVRGLGREGVQVWLLASGEPAELGSAEARRGEAVLHAEFPVRCLAEERMQAIAVLRNDASRGPLLLGLISGTETMTAARTACLALSKTLREKAEALPHRDAAVQAQATAAKADEESGSNTFARRNPHELSAAASAEPGHMQSIGDPSPDDAEAQAQAGPAMADEKPIGKAFTPEREPETAAPYPSPKPSLSEPAPSEKVAFSRDVFHHNAPLSHQNASPLPAGALPDAASRPFAPHGNIHRHISPTSRAAATICAPFSAAFRHPGRNVFTLRRPVTGQTGMRTLPMEEIRRAMDTAGKLSRQAGSRKRRPAGNTVHGEETLREAYFPAIDPLPYVAAEEVPTAAAVSASVPETPSGSVDEAPPVADVLPEHAAALFADRVPVPADALPELLWPPQFETVREMFLRCLPCGRFCLPGWRFVRASAQEEGLWIGRQAVEGQVIRIAYIHPGSPEANSEYQPLTGTDGKPYRALVQRI